MSQRINLHLYPSYLVNETRVLRITEEMARMAYFDAIRIIGKKKPPLAQCEQLDDKRYMLRIRVSMLEDSDGALAKYFRFFVWFAKVYRTVRRWDVRCINAHSLSVLPFCVLLKYTCHRGAALVYDPHELETETVMSHGLRKRFVKAVERAMIGHVDRLFVVSEKIAQWYETAYPNCHPIVIRNIPDEPQPTPAPGFMPLKAQLGLSEETVLFLYVGILSPDRNCRQLASAFMGDAHSHHIVFIGDGALRPWLQNAAKVHSRIHYMDMVKSEEVVSRCAGADVGMIYINTDCLSYRYCLPNKFFQYLKAGCLLAANDTLEEIAKIIRRYDIGWLLDENLENLPAQLANISMARIRELRGNLAEANAQFTHEKEALKLRQSYDELFSAMA